MSSDAVFTSRRLSQTRAAAFSAAEVMRPNLASELRIAIVVFWATELPSTSPCLRRSSGTSASPSFIAATGLRLGTVAPLIVTVPEV